MDTKAFWRNVNKNGVGGCWLWMGACVDGGYGEVRWEGKVSYVHRVSYALLAGKIPKGLQLDHLCRVRNCVNPVHLEAVPQRINILRGESPAARNSKKTSCLRGHQLTVTGVKKYRYCKTCNNLRRKANRRARFFTGA